MENNGRLLYVIIKRIRKKLSIEIRLKIELVSKLGELSDPNLNSLFSGYLFRICSCELKLYAKLFTLFLLL